MKEFVSSVSPKGQITLPAEVRRQLGLKPKDKVAIQLDGDDVRLVPTTFTLESAAGSVPALKEARTWEQIDERVKEERDERLLAELNRE